MTIPGGYDGRVWTMSYGQNIASTGFSVVVPSFGPFVGGVLMGSSGTNHIELWAGIAIFGVVAGIGHLIIGRKMSKEINRMEGGCRGS